MECTKCSKAGTARSPLVACDGCPTKFCKSCSGLHPSEIAVLEIKGKRLMKFYCPGCLKGETFELLKNTIEDKNTIIKSKEKVIELLEQNLEKTKQELMNMSVDNTRRYSEVLTSIKPLEEINNRSNVPLIICKPKSDQDVMKTKQDLITKLKINAKPIGINSLKIKSGGTVLLKCNSEKSHKELRKELVENMSDKYDIKETKLRLPEVFISNIENDIKADEVIESIKNQNDFFSKGDQIEIAVLKPNKKKTAQNCVLRCNGTAFKKMIHIGKVYIGLRRCEINENVTVTRCYKCLKFNHKSKDCKYTGPDKCSFCVDSHHYTRCKSQEKTCINCVESNRKYGTSYPTSHSALDKDCELFKQQMDKQKERTDYKTLNITVE